MRLASGVELHATRVLVACGAFTNGPSRLLPAPASARDASIHLALTNTTTQTVQFALGDADAARLDAMPSIICKFPSFWAYILPPIRYPDGRVVLKLGGARNGTATGAGAAIGTSPAIAMERTAIGTAAATTGPRPLSTPDALIQWYRSGGDPIATAEMTAMLH